MTKPIIIGIAGGSASGKTTLAHEIKETFADEKSVVILRQDSYYKDQSDMTFEQRLETNYDHPFAFDNDLLIDHLHKLISGQNSERPIYDFVHYT